MRSKDWKSKITAKILVIAEDPNLQWSDKVTEYAMFADYYFRPMPYDHGERSRYMEAKNLFDMVKYLSDFEYDPQEVYITHLCNDSLELPPRGKRTLIPEEAAMKGLDHIKWILNENPEIEIIFATSMQVNYWLQKLGFCTPDEEFIKGAEPRRTGIESYRPYYQPVNPKAFNNVCGKMIDVIDSEVKLIPTLAVRDFPLRERNIDLYGVAYEKIKTYYEAKHKEKAL